MTFVAPLRSFGRADLALAGGKGANLGELLRAGFPVPDGFVVTTDAYAAVVAGADLRVAQRLAGGGAAAVRAALETATVPEPVRAAVAAAYAALGGGPVAVRSSATAEDLPGAAFAGQQDTYLQVVGEAAVVAAVRRCWSSLWTDRAVAYRRERDIAPDGVGIAVVVQRMVAAETAGVLFTADPVTGDRGRIVVDASSGLGEAVVSGLVTPDHYVLDRRGRVREWTAGRREVVVRGAADGGVTHDTGEAGPGHRLADPVLAELARHGTAVARHFGRPQDIEWAYADGQVRLLQARPMTALPPPPVRLDRVQRRLASVLLEYLPVRPYPIDMSSWVPYGPAGLMAEVVRHFGIRHAFDGFLPEVDGVVDRIVPPAPRPGIGVLRAPWRLVSLARRYDPARWTDDPRFVDFLARMRELMGRDLTAMSWHELAGTARDALAAVRPVTALRIAYLPRTGLSMVRLLLALAVLRRTSLLGDLVHGVRTRTTDANEALEALATQVRDDPRLAEAVDSLDPARLAGFAAFRTAFAAFLAEYGHRETASPILVTPPTWVDSPETVLGLVKVLAAKPHDAVPRTDDALTALLDHPRLRSPRRRERITRWVWATRAGLAFREDSHFYFTKPLPVLRRSLLEMGQRLHDAAVLAAPEDVFHLRLEELEAVSDPERLTAAARDDLRATVRARSARRAELAGVRLIDPRAVFPRTDAGDALVTGTPASAGVASGPVRVVREPADFPKLTAGDVLVCPYTNPSWTPLFPRAAAVVVDAGGAASHAAIVAREYGIPAVMGTADGTTVLADGQVVTVDGDTGRVTAGGS